MTRKLRINRSNTRRWSLSNIMVISHHRINPQTRCVFNFRVTQTSRINRDNQIRTHILHFINGAHRHSVTLNKPIRNKRTNFLKAKLAKRIQQNCRCTQPVNIVIAVNNNFLTLSVRLFQAVHRFFHIWQ